MKLITEISTWMNTERRRRLPKRITWSNHIIFPLLSAIFFFGISGRLHSNYLLGEDVLRLGFFWLVAQSFAIGIVLWEPESDPYLRDLYYLSGPKVVFNIIPWALRECFSAWTLSFIVIFGGLYLNNWANAFLIIGLALYVGLSQLLIGLAIGFAFVTREKLLGFFSGSYIWIQLALIGRNFSPGQGVAKEYFLQEFIIASFIFIGAWTIIKWSVSPRRIGL